jgi:bifunctional NMN adenylyltransferase/nudix hydrolase
MAKKVSVYIGRFQPFHLGHQHVLRHAHAESDLTIVLVGSANQARTIKNPFTFKERAEMIIASFPNMGTSRNVVTVPLRDQIYNDSKWIQSVQEKVSEIVSKRFKDEQVDIQIVGSDRDESTWYLSAFPQYKSRLIPPFLLDIDHSGHGLNATELRQRLFEKPLEKACWYDVPFSTFLFLQDFVKTDVFNTLKAEYDFMQKYKRAWQAAPYAPTFNTVDGVVIQSGHVLVVERGALPGKGLWALPGGFLDQKERLQDAVVRELVEETGIKVPKQVMQGSIKAKEIFDDPNRSLRGRTITTAFLIRLDDTKPLPKVKGQNAPLHETGGAEVVETAKAFWLPISEARANSEKWFEDHLDILDTMIGMIKD